MPGTPQVTLYTRKGCCLCDDAKRVLESVRGRAVFELHEVDIDTDAGLRSSYNDEVPVIAINGRNAAMAVLVDTKAPATHLASPDRTLRTADSLG